MTDQRKREAVTKALGIFVGKAGQNAVRQATLDMLCRWADSLGNAAAAKTAWSQVVDTAWAEVQTFSGVKFAM